MRRIVVVGVPGSGKTTTATELARVLGLPRVELDALHWEPDWTEADPEVLRERMQAAVVGDEWVVDGNYFSLGSSDIIWPRADTIVFLDLPKRVVVWRVFTRTMRRSFLRTELWSGNRETLKKAFFASDSILWFVWREYPKYARYHVLRRDPTWAHLEWITLRTPDAVRDWLSSLA